MVDGGGGGGGRWEKGQDGFFYDTKEIYRDH